MDLLRQVTTTYLLLVGALATGVVLALVIMYARGRLTITKTTEACGECPACRGADDTDWWK